MSISERIWPSEATRKAGRTFLPRDLPTRWIGALAIILLSATAVSVAEPRVAAVEGVTVTVADIERSSRFFAEVLDFERIDAAQPLDELSASALELPAASTKIARLRLGDENIELIQFAEAGRPMRPDSRANDRWFQHIAIITSDMDAAYARLQSHKVQGASHSPQTLPDWNPNAAGIRAYYFRDLDGHFLEILEFPPDKGDPEWQGTNELFLGIDHTAIVVADTEASLRFYRDRLGLRVAGGSENYGTEQDRLNDVPGAHLRITTLRATRGLGIELLEYLAPRDGRPYPADSTPRDLWHWHVRLRADGSTSKSNTGQLQRDPDGHAVLISRGR